MIARGHFLSRGWLVSRASVASLALAASCLVGCQSDVERHSIPASDLPPPSSPRPRGPGAGTNAMPGATSTAESDPASAPIPTTSAPGNAGGAPGEIVWTAPPRWTVAPNPSPMRKATYKIPKSAGDPEDAEMSVTLASGALDANIARWSGQFDDATTVRSERTLAGGLKVTIVEIHGALKGSATPMAGGPATDPKKGWALLGAIAENPGGMTFFKMTGPAKTVGAARPEFDSLVASLHVR